MIPDSSVWFEEVDSALISFISSKIQLPNMDGSTSPVRVIVRKPDEDFKEDDFPLVSVYNLSSTFSRVRYSPEPVVVERNADNVTTVVEDSALPFDLSYQIDFWSESQVQRNLMTQQWLSKTGFHFNLPVVDQSGEKRTCSVLMTEPLKKTDVLNGKHREFHSHATYTIQVELDPHTQTTIPIVLQSEVGIKPHI